MIKTLTLEEIFNLDKLFSYRVIYRNEDGGFIASIQCATHRTIPVYMRVPQPTQTTHGQYFKNDLSICEEDRHFYAIVLRIDRNVYILYKGAKMAYEVPRDFYYRMDGTIGNAVRYFY